MIFVIIFYRNKRTNQIEKYSKYSKIF